MFAKLGSLGASSTKFMTPRPFATASAFQNGLDHVGFLTNRDFTASGQSRSHHFSAACLCTLFTYLVLWNLVLQLARGRLCATSCSGYALAGVHHTHSYSLTDVLK